MTFRKNLFKYALLASALTLSVSLAHAQGGPGDDPDPKVPIDGGLSLVIAAGIGYAVKRGRDQRKKIKETNQSE